MEPLDWGSLRENCAGDEALVNEVLALFLKEADPLLSDVRAAVTARDALQIKRTAHRLKGALVSLGAKPSVEAARGLELSGAGNDLATVDAMFTKLETEMGRLIAVISSSSASASAA